MSKVLRFPGDTTKEEWAKEVLAAIMEQGRSVAVIIQASEEAVLSAYWNCCAAEKQVLLGHMQIDIVDDYVRATYGVERD